MQQIINFIKDSFQTKEFSSSDRQALKKLISVKQPSAHELNVLRSELFGLIENQSNSADVVKLVNWIEGINKCLLPKQEDVKTPENRCYFSPGDDCENAIVSSIRNAKHSVKICVFTISENVISDAVVKAHKKGISVKIITDNDKLNDMGSDIRMLSKAGIRIRIDQSSSHMHHKFCVVDKEVLLTGSYNWTKSAADRNQENILVTEDPKMVKSYLSEFEKLWDLFKDF
ncbi:phospholipase D-like domain-containing protein [bacterium]|nr:phospholipase D-like domain-containing protein [bacterium]MDC1188303.1 phospholipase D-like domain-containing protein [Flavobacteriales bacterium]MDG1516639.1 phospholipase D-like domain-containing protein [Flavobacteriales bacterium]